MKVGSDGSQLTGWCLMSEIWKEMLLAVATAGALWVGLTKTVREIERAAEAKCKVLGI